MKYTCVIFDLDGTLVDTTGDIALSMNTALEANGYPVVPTERYPALTGNGIKKLAFACLPQDARADAVVEKVAADAARFYAEKPIVHSKPYPGMTELVSALAAKKFRCAVISNKPDPIARVVVTSLFPAWAFGAIFGERPGVPRKPDPAAVWEILVELGKTPRDTVLVGDSDVDMLTARNSECFPLAVSWGFRPRRILEEAGAALIADTAKEVEEFLLG